MNVQLPIKLAAAYRSSSQRARVITEAWAASQLYCPACSADQLVRFPANTQAVDFECGQCEQSYQLKGKSSPFTNKVVAGAYHALITALRGDAVPNLFLLQYDRATWSVVNLLLVPSFAFPPSSIECRKALSVTARRAGWVGCVIVLSRIPSEAKICVIRNGLPVDSAAVRTQYQRLQPLREIEFPERGWALDVLNVARTIGRREFTNADMYARSQELQALHPENRHITDKIRQQLQILRDTGLLTHVGRGRWRLA